MTREEAKKLLPIIEAYANGATIETEIIKGNWNVEKLPTFCLNANKYRIKLKEKFDPKTLKPFDKVVVRDTIRNWKCGLFSHIKDSVTKYKYSCIGSDYVYCIPYNDETKHLVGTYKEAPEYYRYWEG